jgi:predicted CoA-substrate-specific enzyme activase
VLLSNNVSKEDILASTFHAIAHQTLNTLLQGFDVVPKVLLTGGPFFFFSELRNAFKVVMNLNDNDLFLPQHPHLISALGSAMGDSFDKLRIDLKGLVNRAREEKRRPVLKQQTNPVLFKNNDEMINWAKQKEKAPVERIDIHTLDGQDLFIGIDAGSTTTKIIVTDENGKIAFDFYTHNKGDQIGSVRQGLEAFTEELYKNDVNVNIKRTAVAGYGEDLIKAAYGIDDGFVETLAHYRAAKHFNSEASFVLDIGGQDMKAIFIENNTINRIEINEACSSGCGTFIETFANSLNYNISEFGKMACLASAPYDLGTRCTVFMNSKVKQALKEGASVENIAAGLAYSIIRNCFHKVLKIRDFAELGDNIMVQGGTFLNDSVLRAAEICTGKNIIRPDIAELMGAYGASLLAIDKAGERESEQSGFIGLSALEEIDRLKKKSLMCKGCSNHCRITEFLFANGVKYHSGNRCEKVFSFETITNRKGVNLWQSKYELIFNRKTKPDAEPIAVIGIPRALNMYEHFPFWCTLFVESGLEVVLSSPSTNKTSEYATGTITSENICFPAKLVHGHVKELIKSNVDRIFFPMVIYEDKLIQSSQNSYNCPVVAGYPEVIRSTINPSQQGVALDSLAVSFKEHKLLKKRCFQYLRRFNVPKKRFNAAFDRALKSMAGIRQTMKALNEKTLQKARDEKRQSIMVIGKPYHLDPLINHNIADIINCYDFDVLTEDIANISEKNMGDYVHIISQWEYANRLYNLAKWVREHKDIHCIQLNSFGCGTDAVNNDEVKAILMEHNKTLLDLRIDEMTSSGSLKLRIRSMMESMTSTGKTISNRPKPSVFRQKHIAKRFLPLIRYHFILIL